MPLYLQTVRDELVRDCEERTSDDPTGLLTHRQLERGGPQQRLELSLSGRGRR